VEGSDKWGVKGWEILKQSEYFGVENITLTWIDYKRKIELILKDNYPLGEEIKISIKNFGNEDFIIEGKTGICHDFQVFTLKGEKLPINKPNCELYEIYREPYSIRPNETRVVEKWDQRIYTPTGEKKLIQKGKYKIAIFGLEKTVVINEGVK